jgi:DUF4097 and DUF4098 domain-containing protein YvlB
MKNLFAVALLAAGAAWCQDNPGDRVTVPFTDPARPKTLKCSILNGAITVKGYDGKDAIVEAHARGSKMHRRAGEPTGGMRRLELNTTGLSAEESDNVVVVGTHSMNEDIEVTIQVPVATSLKLSLTNGGDIVVDRISGDVEVNNTNGAAHITHVSGSAIVHALNGKVTVSLDRVTADKAMSFSSLNGDIDVTLPADVKAKVKMKSDNGEIYSDFDVRLDGASRQPIVEDNRTGKGKYRVRFDKGVYGAINGGGPEMQFTTFNGNVYIRKAK